MGRWRKFRTGAIRMSAAMVRGAKWGAILSPAVPVCELENFTFSGVALDVVSTSMITTSQQVS